MAGLSDFAPPFPSAMPAAELSSQVTPTRTTALIDPFLLKRSCYICEGGTLSLNDRRTTIKKRTLPACGQHVM